MLVPPPNGVSGCDRDFLGSGQAGVLNGTILFKLSYLAFYENFRQFRLVFASLFTWIFVKTTVAD
jgi:hypothetical protein